MIDFLKFNDDISDEMLAAYIDGNATEDEASLIETVLYSDKMLMEATEVINDIALFDADCDWTPVEGEFIDVGISLANTQNNIMMDAVITESYEINFDSLFPNIVEMNNDISNMTNEINDDISSLDI